MSLGNVGRGGISLYKKYIMRLNHTNLELFFLNLIIMILRQPLISPFLFSRVQSERTVETTSIISLKSWITCSLVVEPVMLLGVSVDPGAQNASISILVNRPVRLQIIFINPV
jgi:hypothetical protein